MTARWYTLDEHGTPVPATMEEGARWFSNHERIVARDEIGEVTVSTVFLGLDHSFGDGGPVLWETMVFGGPLDREQRRYTSRIDAMKGHAEVLALVREAAR